MKKRIGITGGIGSGKTTVCKIFESMGIPVYYADVEAKKLMISNLSVKKEIRMLLGDESYHSNGKLNKEHISNLIFKDKTLINKLNEIVHPAVKLDAERWFETIFQEFSVPYALKEAALIVENGSYKHLDGLIVVTCPEDIRIQRVMNRDKVSSVRVRERMQNQAPEADKVAVADYVIVNDGQQSIITQIADVHRLLIH
jgi:dephospho-CoA kinase